MGGKAIEIDDNKLGAAIQYFREIHQVSQSKLCKGLCSVATLSRIESGERDVDALLLETLLERLGKTPNQFELILTDFDYKTYQKREQIKRLIDTRETEAASALLASYKKMAFSKASVHKQFVVRCKALLNELQGGSIQETIELLKKAISYTVPDFKHYRIQEYYLSNSELNIIIDIIQRLIELDPKNQDKELLFQVLDYLDEHDSLEKNNRLYPKVAILACRLLMKEKNYDKALEICEKGLERNKGSRMLDYLGELYLIKAQTIEAIQKALKDGKAEVCIDEYLKSYYVFSFCEEKVAAEEIRKHLQEEYQWECIA